MKVEVFLLKKSQINLGLSTVVLGLIFINKLKKSNDEQKLISKDLSKDGEKALYFKVYN